MLALPGCLALHLAGHLPQLMLPALHLASLPFSAPAGSSSELSSSEAAPWLPRCAPTVHAERFIICELTMSPCRVERTEEAESGCAGQWVERETHGRASIEHHCTAATNGDPARHSALLRRRAAVWRPSQLNRWNWLAGGADVARLASPRCSRFPLQATRSAEPRATAASCSTGLGTV